MYFDLYDIKFNKLNIRRPGFTQPKGLMETPENYEQMDELAKKLSEKEPHVRIDFYNINGEIKLGEYTLFQGGGMMPFYPEKWDYELGSYIKLHKKNN